MENPFGFLHAEAGLVSMMSSRGGSAEGGNELSNGV